VSDDLPSWLGTDEDPPERRRPVTRRSAIVVLAVVPWLVVLGLLAGDILPDRDQDPATDPPTHADADRNSTSPSATDHEGPEQHHDSSHGAQHQDPEHGGHLDGAAAIGAPPDDRAVGAVAAAVARSWLTDVGPALRIAGVDPIRDHYLEQAWVERIERGGSTAVVTLQAVVLERDGEVYTDVTLRRLAVPVALGAPGPRPAGPPWWLTDPELDPAAPRAEPVEDDDLALTVAELMADEGLRDVEISSLGRTEDDWLVAGVTARMSDGREVDGPVWLRRTPEGPALVGPPAAGPGAVPPAPSDDSDDTPIPSDTEEHP
jgi:hypothetical protein